MRGRREAAPAATRFGRRARPSPRTRRRARLSPRMPSQASPSRTRGPASGRRGASSMPRDARRRAPLAALVAALCLASAPGSAVAFCRTTTSQVPADYDPSVSGCWTQGLPLYWANACVSYDVQQNASEQISYDTAAEDIAAAFSKWTSTVCDGRPARTRRTPAPSAGSASTCATSDRSPATSSSTTRTARTSTSSSSATTPGRTTTRATRSL